MLMYTLKGQVVVTFCFFVQSITRHEIWLITTPSPAQAVLRIFLCSTLRTAIIKKLDTQFSVKRRREDELDKEESFWNTNVINSH